MTVSALHLIAPRLAASFHAHPKVANLYVFLSAMAMQDAMPLSFPCFARYEQDDMGYAQFVLTRHFFDDRPCPNAPEAMVMAFIARTTARPRVAQRACNALVRTLFRLCRKKTPRFTVPILGMFERAAYNRYAVKRRSEDIPRIERINRVFSSSGMLW